MFKTNVGRKQESGVWQYFDYEPSTDKSKCKAPNCTTKIKGKNATNMMNHLVSKHKELAAAVDKHDKDRKEKEKRTQKLIQVKIYANFK